MEQRALNGAWSVREFRRLSGDGRGGEGRGRSQYWEGEGTFKGGPSPAGMCPSSSPRVHCVLYHVPAICQILNFESKR